MSFLIKDNSAILMHNPSLNLTKTEYFFPVQFQLTILAKENKTISHPDQLTFFVNQLTYYVNHSFLHNGLQRPCKFDKPVFST